MDKVSVANAAAKTARRTSPKRVASGAVTCGRLPRSQRGVFISERQCPKAGELVSKTDCAGFDSSGVRHSIFVKRAHCADGRNLKTR